MDSRELPAQPSLKQYEDLANDFVAAYTSGDSEALRRIKDQYQLPRRLTWDEVRAKMQERLGLLRGGESQSSDFELADAQELIADSHGFENWQTFSEYIEAINDRSSPIRISAYPPRHEVGMQAEVAL